MIRVLIATLSLFSLLSSSVRKIDDVPKLNLSNVAELNADVTAVPCDDKLRLSAARKLFENFGATADEITVDKWSNLVVTRKGKGSGRILISAHYDKTGNGSCGATDNWTGIVTIAHIYKAIKPVEPAKTLVFIAFNNEEKGLVGSKAMANHLSKEETGEYCANVNVDSLGLATSQALVPVSTMSLVKLAAGTAAQLRIKFTGFNIQGASSDSASFLDRKIPSITISGVPPDWMQIFHTSRDQVKLIKPDLVHEGYLLALGLVLKLDEAECRSYK